MDQENEQSPESKPEEQENQQRSDNRQESRKSRWNRQKQQKRYKQAEPQGDGQASDPNIPEKSEQARKERPRPQAEKSRHERPFEKSSTDVSVVVPLLNENDSLKELASNIKSVLARMTNRWEVLFIDDGSTDGSFDTLLDLYRSDRRFKTIRFRRNFGKSAALSVGFHNARGEYVITMDADLQDDPEEIPRLIEKLRSGFDLVSGWKKKRKDPINKTIPSKFFNFVTGKLSGIKIHDFNCGLKAYKQDVIKSVQLYGEMHRYIPVLAKMAGFSVTEIPVTHHARKYGRTKFGASRFFKGFLDLLTVLFTSRYTQRPLHLFGTMGMLFFLAGFGINIYLSVEWWMGRPISNRPMLFLGILLILVGIQSISTGLLAEMIAKTQHSNTHYSIKSFLK